MSIFLKHVVFLRYTITKLDANTGVRLWLWLWWMATKVAVGCGHNQSDQKGHFAKRQADSARLARSAARVAVYTTEKGQTRACTKKEKEDGT